MSYSDPWMKKAKWLTQALILSGTLNIGLVSTFVYFVLQEKQSAISFDLKPLTSALAPNPHLTNKFLVLSYSTLSFSELLLRLEDKELVEEGYAKRDLALACLVNFHHFNLEGALGGLLIQQRTIKFSHDEGGEIIDLAIFPGLADYQFQAIAQFAKTEKWPYTSEGLFFEIKRAPVLDPTLLEAFYLTPEFHSVATLFTRGGLNVAKEEIIALLKEGDFQFLEAFTKEQKTAQDLSPNRLKAFLASYLNVHSKKAASWLLAIDPEFMCKRLDDAQTLEALSLVTEKTKALEAFAKELLISPRSDAVWKKAASVLYSFGGQPMPEPYDHNTSLAKFCPHLVTPKKIEQVVQVIPAKKMPEKIPLKKEKEKEPAPVAKKIHTI